MSRETQHIGGGRVVSTDIIDTVTDLRLEKLDALEDSRAHWYNATAIVNGTMCGARMIISDELMEDEPMLEQILERAILKAAQR